MKLTPQTRILDFTAALGAAAMQSSVEACGERSYAAACGSLEFLIYSICQANPGAIALVNEYVQQHPAAPAFDENRDHALCQAVAMSCTHKPLKAAA